MSRLTNTIAAMMTKSRQRQRQSSLPRQSLSQKEKTHQRQKLPEQLSSRRAKRRRSGKVARQTVSGLAESRNGRTITKQLPLQDHPRKQKSRKFQCASAAGKPNQEPTVLTSSADVAAQSRAHSTTEGRTLQLLAVPAKVVEKGFLKGWPCNH